MSIDGSVFFFVMYQNLMFPYKITQVYSKISNTMQEGRLTFVFLFRHVGRAPQQGNTMSKLGILIHMGRNQD
jgi:hypothetical protein